VGCSSSVDPPPPPPPFRTQDGAFDAEEWAQISNVISDVAQINAAQHQINQESPPKEDQPLGEQQQTLPQHEQVCKCHCQPFIFMYQPL